LGVGEATKEMNERKQSTREREGENMLGGDGA